MRSARSPSRGHSAIPSGNGELVWRGPHGLVERDQSPNEEVDEDDEEQGESLLELGGLRATCFAFHRPRT
jgi:hypothetical protein